MRIDPRKFEADTRLLRRLMAGCGAAAAIACAILIWLLLRPAPHPAPQAGPVPAGVMEIDVQHVGNAMGYIRVSVCLRQELTPFATPSGALPWAHCVIRTAAAARESLTVLRLDGLPPGEYSAVAWHDMSGRGVMQDADRIGFSGMADDRSWHVPQSFNETGFRFPAQNRIVIALHHRAVHERLMITMLILALSAFLLAAGLLRLLS